MKTLNGRFALLTGASISALGIAGPAFAAPHDALLASTTVAGTSVTDNTPPVDDTIVICDILSIGPDCTNGSFVGIFATGTGAVTANVTSTTNGQVELFGAGGAGTVDIAVINAAGDSAEIGAVAIAEATLLGLADADATLNSAISVNLPNTGWW